jgi:serine/threonine protein kinase
MLQVILEKNRFPEAEAKPIFYQIAAALNYMHRSDSLVLLSSSSLPLPLSNGVIHRDIKPENILVLNDLDPKTGVPVIKILDFGLSKHTGGGSVAKTFVGTPCYLAPEVEQASLQNGSSYDTPADCWSLGAVLYVMLVAHFPEFDRNVGRVGRILLRLPPHLWNDISLQAKSLVQGLLCYETDIRLTAGDAMRHEWIGTSKEVVLHSKNYLSHPPSKVPPVPPKHVYDLITSKQRGFDVPPIQIPPQVPRHQLNPSNFTNPDPSLQATSNNMISAYQNAGEMVMSDYSDVYLRITPMMALQRFVDTPMTTQ